jgi:hypothetical protein
MPEIIQCPSCQRELQVPEDFIGRPVKCPSCGLNFVTSKQSSSAPPSAAGEAIPAAPSQSPFAVQPPPVAPRPSAAIVVVPAVFLLMIGLLALLIDVADLVFTLNPDIMPTPQNGPPELIQIVEQSKQAKREAVGFYLALAGFFAVGSVIIIAGALQMMRRKMWGLALAGSIIAMLHINQGCCCVGLPIGLWCVIILCMPSVRSLFE